MRITTLGLAALLSSLAAQAQTYYYINSIVVDPPAPTTSTPVTITVQGALSNTASVILSTAHAVNGFEVDITINAGNQGIGLDVLVPHDETFDLGLLAAGTYTIAFNGSNILDLATEPEHEFAVSGGGASVCDSVIIDHINWHPFTDTALEVRALNISQTCFDYPGFVLLQNGDTLAKQVVDFFCLPGDASHLLPLHPGAVMPTGPFTGELHLWTGFYAEQQCIFPVTTDLCPPPPCMPLQPYLVNYGGAIVETSLAWGIYDEDQAFVTGGEFQLIDSVQGDYDTTCLAPGQYNMIVASSPPIGGQLFFGLSTGWLYGLNVSATYLQNNLPNTISFTYYGPCIDGGQLVPEFASSAVLNGHVEADRLIVERSDGNMVGPFALVDVLGQIIRNGRIMAPNGQIDLHDLASGNYLLTTSTARPLRFVR